MLYAGCSMNEAINIASFAEHLEYQEKVTFTEARWVTSSKSK